MVSVTTGIPASLPMVSVLDKSFSDTGRLLSLR